MEELFALGFAQPSDRELWFVCLDFDKKKWITYNFRKQAASETVFLHNFIGETTWMNMFYWVLLFCVYSEII